MIYISKNGIHVEHFEDSNIQNKSSELHSFMVWIESKTKDNNANA